MNFCLDGNGDEHPIRYKAVDLVNKPAPAGYHWERRRECLIGRVYSTQTREAGGYDYYIAVKDKDPNASQELCRAQGKQWSPLCTLALGHPGNHEVIGLDGEIHAIWRQA